MFGRVLLYYSKPLTRHIVCVPKHKPPDHKDVKVLQSFLTKHDKILVVSGAGISTESGTLNQSNTHSHRTGNRSSLL